MRIGIDFDNTLARYDEVFSAMAREMGLVKAGEKASKQGVRRLARRQEDGEILWQRMQGEVYGLRMRKAEQFAGEDGFLRRCAATPGVEVFIVSHKTEFGHFDETRTSLRDAAREWMRDKGFFDPEKYAIPESHLFFESTRQEKVERIGGLQCDMFIDDLPEVFQAPSFPEATKRILFSESGNPESAVQADHVCASWSEIEAVVFGN